MYSRDDHPETLHLGGFDGRPAGGHRLPLPGGPAPPAHAGPAGGSGAWPPTPTVRGQGFGTAVLDASVAHVAAEGGGELWCNARVPALGFYRRCGFEVDGDEFEIDGIGPHVVMTRTVDPAG